MVLPDNCRREDVGDVGDDAWSLLSDGGRSVSSVPSGRTAPSQRRRPWRLKGSRKFALPSIVVIVAASLVALVKLSATRAPNTANLPGRRWITDAFEQVVAPTVEDDDPNVCNKSQLAPMIYDLVPAWAMSNLWHAACQTPPVKSSEVGWTGAVPWEGKDWCWEWVKKVGCYDVDGTRTWNQAQELAAKLTLAPSPLVYNMSGLASPLMCDRYENGKPPDASYEDISAARLWFDDNVQVFLVDLGDIHQLTRSSEMLHALEIEFDHVNLQGVHWEAIVPSFYNKTQAELTASQQGWQPNAILPSMATAVWRLQALRGIVDMGLSWGTPGDDKVPPTTTTQSTPPTTSSNEPAHIFVVNSTTHTFTSITTTETSSTTTATTSTTFSDKPLALVLEGDIVLEPDFIVRLWKLVTYEALCHWQVINLKARCPYGVCVSPHLARVLPDGNEPESRCRVGTTQGMHSMLYRVKELKKVVDKLEQVVWDSSRPFCLEVDVALASASDELLYYAVPYVQHPGLLTERTVTTTRTITSTTSTTSRSTTSTSFTTLSLTSTTSQTTGPLRNSTTSSLSSMTDTSTVTSTTTSTPLPEPQRLPNEDVFQGHIDPLLPLARPLPHEYDRDANSSM